MTRKKTSKRAAGKRLNEAGRESPLEVFQLRQEYYSKLAKDEMEKGVLGSREQIGEYLKLAQEAAEALAPYRHARLTPTDAKADEPVRYVIRVPHHDFKSVDEWHKHFAPQFTQAEAADDKRKADELIKRINASALEKQTTGKLN